jgi:6-phosphogluconolactonase (cycloisomerase 2 family)
MISSGAFSTGSGSPTSVNYTPQSMVVSTDNKYLFVASGTIIYTYSIGTNCALSFVSNLSDLAQSITVSPDGQWLLALENGVGATSTNIDVYSLSGGAPTATGSKAYLVSAVGGVAITALSAETIQVAPDGAYLVVALGKGGALVIPFTTSNGAVSTTQYQIGTAGSTSGFYALAIDTTSSYLYLVGASNGSPVIQAYTVNSSSGVPNTTPITQTASPTVGGDPLWVTVSSNNAYVYVANNGTTIPSVSATITELSSTSGQLASIGTVTSPPSSVSALGRDSTGNYLVALGFNTASGLQPYTINSGGTLSAGTSVGSGNVSVAAAIAMSH